MSNDPLSSASSFFEDAAAAAAPAPGGATSADPGLFDALIWQESRGRQSKPDGTPLTSTKGAIGVAQVMPKTAPEAAKLAGLDYDEIKYRNDPEYNRALGRAYFNKQLQDFGDETKALAAYNAGPGALQHAMSVAESKGHPDAWLQYLPAETQAYVPAIMKKRGARAAAPAADGSTSSGDAYYTPDRTRYVTYKDPGPGASTMDFFKEVAASAVDSIGSAAQGAGEIAAAVANKASGTENYAGFNPLTPVTDKVRGSMTEGGRTAREQSFQGDVLDPSTWQLPSSQDGWIMAAANGFGSMAATILPVLGQSGKAASLARAAEVAMKAGDAAKAAELTAAARAASRGAMAIGAGTDAAVTGGAAAGDVRQSAAQTVAGMTHDQLMTSVPVYAQIFSQTGDEQQARSGVVNRAAQLAGAFSAAAGAAGGAFNARVLEDFIGHKGMSKVLGDSVGSRTGRAAIGAGVGHAAEGLQETSEKVGQNMGENVALGRDATDNVTRDTLGDFAGGAMIGTGAGAVGGATTGPSHAAPAAPAVPPGLETVARKAGEADSPLSRAALAGNTGPLADAARAATAQQQQQEQAEAAKPDPISDRAAQIAATIRSEGALQKLRAKDSPVKVQTVLNDLALAQSPSAQAAQREQAVSRLEYALEWAGVQPAAQASPAIQQIVGDTTDPTAAPDPGVIAARNPAALAAQGDAATGTTFGPQPAAPAPEAVAYDNTAAAAQRAEQDAQQQASNAEAAAKLPPAPDVDHVVRALKIEPALRSAEQTALVKQAQARYQPEDMQLLQQAATYAAGMSATQKLRVQQLRGVANPALVVGREEGGKAQSEVAAAAPAQAEPNLGTDIPNLGTPAPAGEGPAVFRKRRATLRSVIDLGMTSVEREGTNYFLTDGKKRFRLDGPADAQLARRELHAKIAEGASQANTAPTDGQKEAGNYKKGRVEFDGLKIGIENPIGSERSGTAPDGTKWSVKMSAHYGDLTSTTGADGDGVDVYLVQHPRAGSPAFVFDQYGDDGKFDEHKVVLGVPTEEEATKIYDAHFSDGSGPKRRRAVTAMSAEEFKAWANSPAAKKPAAGDKSGKAGPVAAAAPAGGAGSERADAARGVADAGAGRVGGDVADGADNPATGAVRRGGANGAVDHAGERAYVTVPFRGRKRQVPVIDITKLGTDSPARAGETTKITKKNAELIQALAKAFGKEVVFFQNPEKDLGDGFVLPNVSTAIFINESTSIQPLAVFGHELMHLMQRDLPQAHAAIRAVVNARVKEGGRQAFRDDYNGKSEAHTDEALNSDELEEITSDLGGNLMSDPAFWREVMDQVQKDHPEQSKKLLAQFAAKIYAIIDQLVAYVRGIKQPGFRVDEFVNDLQGIRGAVRQGLADYIAANNISRAGMQAQVLKEQKKGGDVLRSAAREKSDNADDALAEDDSASGLGQEPGRAAAQVPEYGTPREGAVSVLARHYGTEARKELSSAAYGRGYKGGERERVQKADDKRLRSRSYFYVDQGHGITPEAGVGPHAHEVRLNNIYDPRTKLVKSTGGANGFESAVLDAGFDGYLNPEFTTKQGAVVLLGKHNVPVKYIGTPANAKAQVAAEPETLKKGLLSRELRDIDLQKIPGATVESGSLVIPAKSREQANSELERIESTIRFSPAREADAPVGEHEEVERKYRGTEQWMKAPNGEKTKLSERQWIHVRTPSFKNWFGDWEKLHNGKNGDGVWSDNDGAVSKVVDANGEPLVVYHGTDTGGFAEFRDTGGKTRGDLGVFATDKPDMAASYVRIGRASTIKEGDVESADTDSPDYGTKSGIYALFLNIRHATEENFDGAQWSGDYFDENGKLVPERNIGRVTDDVVREARNVFHADGAIIRNLSDDGGGAGYSGDPGDVFVAFDPANIKSADFNSGAYSVDSRDIRFSKTRKVEVKPEVAAAAGTALKFLTPTERSKLRVDTATKLADLFQKMPSANEMAAVAYAGKAKRGWYHESAQALMHVFGPDAPRFAALLAALSPQTSVEINLRNALATWKNWTRAGRPTDKSEIFQIMGRSVEGNKLTDSVLPAWVPNSVRALTAEDPESVVLSGPKVNSFMLNLRGVAHEVTNDAWMANYAAVDQRIFSGGLNAAGTDPGKGPGYLAMSARVRQAAKKLTDLTGEDWTPAEVQETVWSWAKTLYELQDKQMGARELLENEAVTDELIQSTPDFRSQLHEERNEETLRQAGYGAEVDSLRGRGRDDGSGAEGSEARGKAEPFDRDAQGKLLRKAASRLEELKVAREQAEARTRELNAADVPEDIRQSKSRGLEPGLEGLPRYIEVPGYGTVIAGRLEKADEVAHKYMADAGLLYSPPSKYAKVDAERAKRIARAYEEMKHDPQAPAVKAAYDALVRETTAQYRAALDSGLKVEFIDVSKGDPYAASPRLVTEDVRNNNHMWVFSTRDGFGSSEFDAADNPLLAETEFEISGQKALVNDLFRVVHDYFGHVKEGLGFRADGEENAWRSHWAMFTPAARKALTTETRGQNSWVNYGPKGDANRTAAAADTVFADQKTGLLPDWVVHDGAMDSAKESKARNVVSKDDVFYRGLSDPYQPREGFQYWTDKKVAAQEYGTHRGDGKNAESAQHLVAAKLTISNPLVLKDDETVRKLAKELGTSWDPSKYYSDVLEENHSATLEYLRKNGYDGVVMDDGTGGTSHDTVVTISPKQVSLVDDAKRSTVRKPSSDAAFIGYLSPDGKFEAYSEAEAKQADYHHSFLVKDLDAYEKEGGLTFVRMMGEAVVSIKGTPAMDPYAPKSQAMISDLARRIIASGADEDMPIKVEDMGFKRTEAPYQKKEIGTLQQWVARGDAKRSPTHDDALVQARKDASVLKSLIACLGA